jgi:hypothetical protein
VIGGRDLALEGDLLVGSKYGPYPELSIREVLRWKVSL